MIPKPPVRLLIVAGHDPSGAGIDADRASVRGLDVETIAVLTAHTQQDDRAVSAVGARDPALWLAEALERSTGGVAALKFGLLPGAEHLRAARELIQALRARHGDALPIVLDPVIAASSGARFLDEDAVAVLREELATLDVCLTPNLSEAAELCGQPEHLLASTPAARSAAARTLLTRGAAAVIIKGGHATDDPVRDLLAVRDAPDVWLEHPRIPGGKIRGSGCRFASHLAARLALGGSLEASARAAGDHVAAQIAQAASRASSTTPRARSDGPRGR